MFLASYSSAHAVRIIPPRLVLGPDVKIEYMFIKNNSDKTEAFRFGWKHLAMDKDGNVLNIDKIGIENAPNGYKPLDDLIRFSPRRTVIDPGQTQRITFMIKRSQSLESGEYRSHFLVQREPKKALQTQKSESGNVLTEDELSSPNVSVDVLVSRAVPIYILNGETNAKLNFVTAEIKKNTAKTQPYQPDHLAYFKVQKEGNRSVIGVAQVLCNSDGKEVIISKPVKVFAVYAEGEYRNEQMAVQIPAKGCSSYRLLIKGHNDDILANQTLIDQTFNK